MGSQKSQAQSDWSDLAHARTHGSSMSDFLNICQLSFHRGCAILHSHQQSTAFQLIYILTNTYAIVLKITAILEGVK